MAWTETPCFHDRRDGGRALAALLAPAYGGRDDVVVLGLPRGGLPVAYEVALALGAPLDAFSVRKLGVPGHEELAMGAIGSGGALVFNDDVVAASGIGSTELDRIVARERRLLERAEEEYRAGRPFPALAGKSVLLVDDGVATGASMLAAITALRRHAPAYVVVAVPVAPIETVGALRRHADEVVAARTPEPFGGVGAWYEDFAQVDSDEARALLDDATRRRAG
jgi:predicted phosphoribosyltransferase